MSHMIYIVVLVVGTPEYNVRMHSTCSHGDVPCGMIDVSTSMMYDEIN